jgi:Rad3-related DNA helicase
MKLTAEDLMAGGALNHEVEVPGELLSASGNGESGASKVVLRPLTVRDLQRIAKASRKDENLSAALMIQQSLVEPDLKLEKVAQMPAGLAHFLVERINAISGIDSPRDELEEYVQTPLAKACFILAKEFGWTPEEASGLTIGQILLYLEMARRESHEA